ncbi:antA/AntB antirepressor family protein [Sporanaerobacter acetigenes]|uniref:antA/AntB antirepressor family protein n=1 Tax=Sporanaerobacter acetigenes TaxID=165813 RepID=UPI003322ED00
MNGLALLETGLVNIYQNDKQERLVDGRELHEFLGVGKDFTTWIKDRIEKYNFINGFDYVVTFTKTGERQNVTRHDYILKMDMAKEISMVENNAKGRLVRKYFIEVEKRYRQMVDTSSLSPQLQMFNQMFQAMANLELEHNKMVQEVAATKEQVSTIKETITARDEDWRSDVTRKIRKIGFKNGNYEEIIKESYKFLEERAGCKLTIRLENLKQRMALEGATKTAINKANYLDVIEADKRLTEIYINIVNQLYVKYAA